MIKEIELKNIRIFEENLNAKFPLPILSIFCGTNSSGKTTILKSLLLLRQSQGIWESSGATRGRLRFVGSQVDLGNYSSLVSNKETQRDISILLSIENEMTSSMINFLKNIGLSEDKKDTSEKVSKKENTSERTQEDKNVKYILKCCFTFSEKQDINEQVSNIQKLDFYSTQGILKSANYELIVDGETLLSWKVRLGEKPQEEDDDESSDEPDYEILIQQDYFKKVGGSKMMDVDLAEDKRFIKVVTVLNGILPVRLISKVHIDKAKKDETSKQPVWSVFPLPPHIEEALQDLNDTLERIHYLGPLRSPAKRYYMTNLDVTPGLDPTGEFLPYILRNKQNEPEVWNIRPNEREKIKEKLSLSLNTWLYYLRVGKIPSECASCKEIEVSATKGVLVEFEIKTVGGARSFALADSGFGYSQVLPIIVRGLLASPGSILIVEQPELHLNPAVQVRLAEFFVAMSRAGKQIIIETHSEHIVNAIRVFAAEDESGELASNSAIFFIDAESKIPVIHELSIKPDGTVPKWPRNFFGEAASLSGRLLRAQKRHREKTQSSHKE